MIDVSYFLLQSHELRVDETEIENLKEKLVEAQAQQLQKVNCHNKTMMILSFRYQIERIWKHKY